MSERLRLDQIEFTAGTQVREAINEQVVGEYAERLQEGAEFPPIIVFHDGSHYFPADGFHRGNAHSRLGRETILADVRLGTREDALWFALGANKANGIRLTGADKKHAIILAIHTWPDRSGHEIADQIGCNHSYVSDIRYQLSDSQPLVSDRIVRRNGRSYPATTRQNSSAVNPKIERVQQMVRDGQSSTEIINELKVSPNLVADARKSASSVMLPDRSPSALAKRRDRMRVMAEEGYTSIQIAADVGLALETCRINLKEYGIAVPADKTTAKSLHLNSTRIVEHIVMDAENLTTDIGLIDFRDLAHSKVVEWVASLTQSREKLGAFIKRLVKETQ